MNLELIKDTERWIFSNYQEEKKVIGRVKLLEFVREGLEFILEDMPKDDQITYGTQYWKCEIVSDGGYYNKGYIKTFPIRYIKNIGVTYLDGFDDFEKEDIIIDKFIEIDGEEIY